jgi:hypothetical protein
MPVVGCLVSGSRGTLKIAPSLPRFPLRLDVLLRRGAARIDRDGTKSLRLHAYQAHRGYTVQGTEWRLTWDESCMAEIPLPTPGFAGWGRPVEKVGGRQVIYTPGEKIR